MPNPKVGTVTPNVAEAVKNAKAGQVRYRVDKNGIIHAPVGRVGFEPAQLQENVEALMADLRKAKPHPLKAFTSKRSLCRRQWSWSNHRSELYRRQVKVLGVPVRGNRQRPQG